MKRFFASALALCLVFMLSVPARAAEKTNEERIKALEDVFSGLSFYGSVRFATFYESSDSDFTGDTDKVTSITPSTPALTRPSQTDTMWALANNSRIGINLDRKDNFTGRVELGLRNDLTTQVRLAWGAYTYNGVTCVVGQDFTPLSDWDYSSQVYFSDNNMAGWGIIDMDGKRLPQLKMKWNGLQVALVHPKNPSSPSATNGGTLGLATTAPTTAYTEVRLPYLEAKYRLTADKLFADFFGGVGTYKVKAEIPEVSRTVVSYACGIGGGVKIDPVYAKAMVWMAKNGKQLSMHQADAAGATLNAADNYSVVDDDDLGYALILGSKIGKMTAEVGYGFVSSEKDIAGAEKDEARNYYANLNIPVAQGANKAVSLSIVPEIGIYDYMEDSAGNDQGKIRYAGAKWQINF